MHLFVRDLAGRTVAIEADPSAEVGSLKEQVAASLGVPTSEQRLLFGGRALESDEVLAASGLQEESTVFLSLGLEGGGKKRKKRTYTKPKKIKHKRKKVKLAVLKFYKV